MTRLRFWKQGDDEEERLRMGRFSPTDQREMEELVRVRSKRKPVGRQPSWRRNIIDRAYRVRVGQVLSHATVGQSTEAILKVASTTKSDAGVTRMVRYIGRINGSDDRAGTSSSPWQRAAKTMPWQTGWSVSWRRRWMRCFLNRASGSCGLCTEITQIIFMPMLLSGLYQGLATGSGATGQGITCLASGQSLLKTYSVLALSIRQPAGRTADSSERPSLPGMSHCEQTDIIRCHS